MAKVRHRMTFEAIIEHLYFMREVTVDVRRKGPVEQNAEGTIRASPSPKEDYLSLEPSEEDAKGIAD